MAGHVAVQDNRIFVSHAGVQTIHFREDVAVYQQQVLPAIVIEVEKTAAPTDVAGIATETCGGGHVIEVGSAAVSIQRLTLVREIRSEYVEFAVSVVIG